MISTFPYDGCYGQQKFSPGLQTDWLMTEQVHPAHLEPYGVEGPHRETAWAFRRGRARIPSWLEADRSLQQEAAYIGADRFTIEDLLAIRRRTIHFPLLGWFDRIQPGPRQKCHSRGQLC